LAQKNAGTRGKAELGVVGHKYVPVVKQQVRARG
jgi:hypothetical protein